VEFKTKDRSLASFLELAEKLKKSDIPDFADVWIDSMTGALKGSAGWVTESNV
jgi:hypothetical protein